MYNCGYIQNRLPERKVQDWESHLQTSCQIYDIAGAVKRTVEYFKDGKEMKENIILNEWQEE